MTNENKKGGRVSKHARIELEQKTGKKIVSKENLKFQAKREIKEIKQKGN